jgi:putative transposase
MQRTFKYRLYPNRQQRETPAAQLEMCRELCNAALQERMESYKTTGKGVTWLQQQAQLPAIKEVRPEFKSVHAHTLPFREGSMSPPPSTSIACKLLR